MKELYIRLIQTYCITDEETERDPQVEKDLCPPQVAYKEESWQQDAARWFPEPRVFQCTRCYICTHIHTSIHAHIRAVVMTIVNDGSELQQDNGLSPS